MVFEEITLSTAYLPPVQYLALMAKTGKVKIEMHENYIRQSYRNRCIIAGPNGKHSIVVPVLHGNSAKTPIGETQIDYSKRWIQVHIRAIEAAYRNSPYYQFYAESIFSVLSAEHQYLTRLNTELLQTILNFLPLDSKIEFTTSYLKPSGKTKEKKKERDNCIDSGATGVRGNGNGNGDKNDGRVKFNETDNDFRYNITPKIITGTFARNLAPYQQVFSERYDFIPDLSVIDLLFNLGPRSADYLNGSVVP